MNISNEYRSFGGGVKKGAFTILQGVFLLQQTHPSPKIDILTISHYKKPYEFQKTAIGIMDTHSAQRV